MSPVARVLLCVEAWKTIPETANTAASIRVLDTFKFFVIAFSQIIKKRFCLGRQSLAALIMAAYSDNPVGQAGTCGRGLRAGALAHSDCVGKSRRKCTIPPREAQCIKTPGQHTVIGRKVQCRSGQGAEPPPHRPNWPIDAPLASPADRQRPHQAPSDSIS